MKWLSIVTVILALGLITSQGALAQTNLSITSSAFKNNGLIPEKYSCKGQNISPPLQFKNIPKNTKSLALTLDDPDAPKGTFNHWIVWNISPKKHQLAQGEKKLSEGLNGIDKSGYFGPCPPSGTHRYNFKLYALDSQIDISKKSHKTDLLAAIQTHIIQSATITGKYSAK